ncbi:MAG: DCC1-like thiol-disulfide oxidoreductase family protein [Microscillaceae bacterium]|nr:DCC1-like thiol-disulfide oxidoreductase family protein [Microscillaceae bacterium]MDW8461105.1 DCC1-like thiol-disulfide oxidoreductase family protein [Cytophagales bacterium]
MQEKSIILFDGVCNLCNSIVNFIIDYDKKFQFQFASLQSPQGQELLQKYNLPTQSLDSFVLIYKGKAYQKSTAALQVAWLLGGWWKTCYIFVLIPTFLRDKMYDWVAHYRYKWFGKNEICRMPTPEQKARFL